ncbi:DNA cytosine methyltransferase [Ruegeria jejuensis]|uniref:DNA cytosine methyltransferase n=1 Tax=Ruegeria jejuensis TaxID=3233338 RepID=UPI00355AF013
MNKEYAIIDLFAGPGGLGEGFSAAGREGEVRMKIRLSVEMERNAIQTLRLRSFLRMFKDGFPPEYYDALNARKPLPDWSKLYPIQWKHAEQEVRQLELGKDGVFEEIAEVLDRTREEFDGNTILIGGPPCQAYSLVGRSRNMGKDDYVAEQDHRHYLYKEYSRILDRLNPAAFVMENVKGMLSSKVDGGGIFHRVLDDLHSAGEGYKLVPLSAPLADAGNHPPARDFILRAEEHGVPQARHRVIVVGIRSDIAERVEIETPLLPRRNSRATTWEAVSGFSKVRSGLSRGDDLETWTQAVRDQAKRIAESPEVPEYVRKVAGKVARTNSLPARRVGHVYSFSKGGLPEDLASWLLDPKLKVVLHHETRGHIPGDLGRYLFSAAFSMGSEKRAPKLPEFPEFLQPEHVNRSSGHFADRFRTQVADRPSTTVTSHISKDGHYFIHPDPMQCRSLTVREAARLQTFPDNYHFYGGRTAQYHQVGNAVPPYLAYQIAKAIGHILAKA